MNNFLPISILGYALNGGSTIIDKILLNKILPSPFVYAFYVSILGIGFILLIPFGVRFELPIVALSAVSGISFVLGLLAFFQSLKQGEASIVAPIVGALNPLFTLLLGGLLLNQTITHNQTWGFFVLIFGSFILTFNLIKQHLRVNTQIIYMLIAGLLFAISYLALAKVYSSTNFLTGLSLKSIAGGLLALSFLLFPKIRAQIFSSKIESHHFANKTTYLLFAGQAMGGTSGLLLNIAVNFANPALVNSLFGVQYLTILLAALFLSKRHPQLLNENLTRMVLVQKLVGVCFLTFGVYLLSK